VSLKAIPGGIIYLLSPPSSNSFTSWGFHRIRSKRAYSGNGIIKTWLAMVFLNVTSCEAGALYPLHEEEKAGGCNSPKLTQGSLLLGGKEAGADLSCCFLP